MITRQNVRMTVYGIYMYLVCSCVHFRTKVLPQDIHLANIVVVRFLKGDIYSLE